jgi:DNA-binding MarR family transcriptional regulator
MIELFESKFLAPKKSFRRLSVLMAIHNFPEISQRKVGGIACLSSSMVNNYVKELQKQELITVTGDTNRTCEYYLTAKGRDELLSLLISYSAEIIRLYAEAKEEIVRRLRQIREDGVRSVALFGASSTAEVVSAGINEVQLNVVGIVDSDLKKQGNRFGGLVIQPPEALRGMDVDAVVVTSFGRQEEIHDFIRRFVDTKIRVLKLSNL